MNCRSVSGISDTRRDFNPHEVTQQEFASAGLADKTAHARISERLRQTSRPQTRRVVSAILHLLIIIHCDAFDPEMLSDVALFNDLVRQKRNELFRVTPRFTHERRPGEKRWSPGRA